MTFTKPHAPSSTSRTPSLSYQHDQVVQSFALIKTGKIDNKSG